MTLTFARRITEAMDARGRLLAPALARAVADVPGWRILDIAGGSGIFTTAWIDACPELCGTVVERVPVDAAARALLADRGYANRVRAVSGDMFKELPYGHDLHLLSHTLHDWDEDAVRQILDISFQALSREDGSSTITPTSTPTRPGLWRSPATRRCSPTPRRANVGRSRSWRCSSATQASLTYRNGGPVPIAVSYWRETLDISGPKGSEVHP